MRTVTALSIRGAVPRAVLPCPLFLGSQCLHTYGITVAHIPTCQLGSVLLCVFSCAHFGTHKNNALKRASELTNLRKSHAPPRDGGERQRVRDQNDGAPLPPTHTHPTYVAAWPLPGSGNSLRCGRTRLGPPRAPPPSSASGIAACAIPARPMPCSRPVVRMATQTGRWR
eukprot:scaffold12042_cov61-Phaeocystis_antarctica.AAC.8